MNLSISLTYLSLIWTPAAALEEGFLMKFLVVSSSTLFGFAAAAEDAYPATPSLEVVSDIFLEQDDGNFASSEPLYSIIGETTASAFHPGRSHGQAHLSPSLVRTLLEKMGIAFASFGFGGGGSDAQVGRIVPTTTLTASSAQHVDHYPADSDGKRRSVGQDRVAFVVLNTNPDAYFAHGKMSVPIVEGSLVHFIGGIPHNTIVNSGSVKLLGPFDVKSFIGVGNFL
ncbi:hypothetical protein ACHAW5_008718 [Stephanodiscus triporus]|uniref:Uncharacterized protein n=1 Tax=Stephanodiscus triporus TaxID=2934178 RepID=A0ABD3NEI7_9STRA